MLIMTKLTRFIICFVLTLLFSAMSIAAGSVVKLNSNCLSAEIVNLVASIRKALANKFVPIYDDNNQRLLLSGFKPLEYINEPVLVFLDPRTFAKNAFPTH